MMRRARLGVHPYDDSEKPTQFGHVSGPFRIKIEFSSRLPKLYTAGRQSTSLVTTSNAAELSLRHGRNRLAQLVAIVGRDAGHVDAAGADDVNRVLFAERFHLLLR